MSQIRRRMASFAVTWAVLLIFPTVSRAQQADVVLPAGKYQGTFELPHIARYKTLPVRMELEPLFIVPPLAMKYDLRFPAFFDRILRESDDPELLEVAARSVARMLRENLVRDVPSIAVLQQHLADPTTDSVAHACALALVEADARESAELLLKASVRGNDEIRLVIEPALAHWKFPPALELWAARLKEPFATQTSVRLACEGLAALQAKDQLNDLTTLMLNPSESFGKHFAAASAIAKLDPAHALQQALPLMKGDIANRLLATALLTNSDPACLTELTRMCADSEDGIASAAWAAVLRIDLPRLQEHLPTGRIHRDAMIRIAAARVMRAFPNPERAAWLNELVSDRHLEVRNVARQMLVQVAGDDAELKTQIVAAAADKIRGTPDDWQGIEQSLLILGQLAADQFGEDCLRLINHPRSEVRVTGAWLLHLFPEASLTERVVARILENEAKMKTPPAGEDFDYEALSLQQMHLYQYAGLTRQTSLQPIFVSNFPKNAPGIPEKRAAAMWALGLLNEARNDKDLAAQFVSRMNDRDGMPPEWIIVRRMSVMAVGMMRATDSADQIQRAYDVDAVDTLIPNAARWALPLLGKVQPPEPEPPSEIVGGWKLVPTGTEQFGDIAGPRPADK